MKKYNYRIVKLGNMFYAESQSPYTNNWIVMASCETIVEAKHAITLWQEIDAKHLEREQLESLHEKEVVWQS